MRHKVIAEFQAEMPKIMAATTRGEDIVVTLDGHEYVKLASTGADHFGQQRAAIEEALQLREERRVQGVRISPEEVIDWKSEGRR